MGWARNTKSEPSASGVINTPPTPQRDAWLAAHTCSDQNLERLNDLAWQHSQQDLHQATAIDWNELHPPSDTPAAPTNL